MRKNELNGGSVKWDELTRCSNSEWEELCASFSPPAICGRKLRGGDGLAGEDRYSCHSFVSIVEKLPVEEVKEGEGGKESRATYTHTAKQRHISNVKWTKRIFTYTIHSENCRVEWRELNPLNFDHQPLRLRSTFSVGARPQSLGLIRRQQMINRCQAQVHSLGAVFFSNGTSR